MLLAHISDLHVLAEGKLAYGVVDTNGLVAAAIADINQLSPQPDLVVATGDLVHWGEVAEYEQLKMLLGRLEMPVYLLPGNHDQRQNLRRVFADQSYLPNEGADGGEYLQYVIDDYPMRLIMLDTVVPGEGGGELDESRLAWLAAQLAAAPRRPTLVFMHHPPFTTQITSMDAIGLKGRDRFAEIISRYPCVERVGCGHLHRPILKRWAGTIAYTVPSLVHQVDLDLRPEAEGQFRMEPPAYHLHLWHDDTGLISHTQYVGSYAGPYPFAVAS
ncbi:phosphodiesterase [Romeria aff. gracilis LEGE 07310]|uniref:Phosphodiesterase n=1 Tax=Vasconcelosia minhoensis LEGE 07310 TaxID=915328 RepID=A0A8J7AAB5_9CYAN|nr:phosphodiesterase [Romeria aff. gracilis LEGE 07310]